MLYTIAKTVFSTFKCATKKLGLLLQSEKLRSLVVLVSPLALLDLGLFICSMDYMMLNTMACLYLPSLVKYQPSSYFQELNENPMFEDVAIYNRTVMTAEQLPYVVDEAIRQAYAHKGVAVVTIPKDLGWQDIEDTYV
ncbi:pyruvate oxidase [Streptococcus dysgalactiae subsp. equisimilis AC-2713]|uniref:Pyruvate oxidase n=1 Tax=Streptococcus dysgalactiae subsp. equisimilis AC-2713 TaxID=759913 RepID=A0AB33R573_STREQ|nr:pyruvate oxidase [Streptococcus dysgalactiae subsp. equisimilis AC-2713]